MKKAFIISGTIISGIALISIAILLCAYIAIHWLLYGTPWELAAVKAEAQQYLDNKYTSEMIVTGGCKTFYGNYQVNAYRKESDVYFNVKIPNDRNKNSDDYYTHNIEIIDDYYTKYFEKQFAVGIDEYVKTLYENGHAYVVINSMKIASIENAIIENKINENSTLDEIDGLTNEELTFYIDIIYDFNDSDYHADAVKLFSIIEYISKTSYNVDGIVIFYSNENDKTLLHFNLGREELFIINNVYQLEPYIQYAIDNREKYSYKYD